MTDEEIIKRRLMFDGDGTGEDRRLNDLVKNIAKWLHASHENGEECFMMFDKILAQLESVKHSRHMSVLRHKQADLELQRYKNFFADMEAKIKEKRDEIAAQKMELEKSKRIKQNRIQYSLLAKSISRETPRTETLKHLESLQSEIAEFRARKELLDQHLDKRKKQFMVLSMAASNLQGLLCMDETDGGSKATKENTKAKE